MKSGHYIVALVGLVSSIGIISILIDILFNKEQEPDDTAMMSKEKREAYFDDNITNSND